MISNTENTDRLRTLIQKMRLAYQRGENAMACAREIIGESENSLMATLISYDLQAGSYISAVKKNPEIKERWCQQVANIINRLSKDKKKSILEIGCGEATTLRGVLEKLSHIPEYSLGFDLSWSRVAYGLRYLSEKQIQGSLFVADLFNIPLADESIDIVYTSHSLEPNGGREKEAIKELLRVARHAVVLIEPIYELASPEAQERMRYHGYIRGLKDVATQLGAVVTNYKLLDFTANPLNPSGLLLLEKATTVNSSLGISWSCPLTRTRLQDIGDVFESKETGLVYPVLRGIPMLTSSAIVASAITDGIII
ncbi:Putative S-adenosyl-L-methionine-dependent methyltransferase [Planktothrix agardhii]|uniref:S-adenosyl-L-methionine-dependent methyltransferase n=2 Tax=Planktothrix agardhii TaxID=1160 RepID=A0AAD1V2J7_PLAAG|nr:Putative S-adenosyl-L-methionine-dependent methyltransferase [Planktothrix agardhii]